MASYLEIKQLLRNIMCIEADVDESCDLLIPIPQYRGDETVITIKNSELKAAFEGLQNYSTDNLELSLGNYREVALQFFSPHSRSTIESLQVGDPVNGLSYSVGPATLDYCMFLLNRVADYVREKGRRIHIDLRHRSRMVLRQDISESVQNNPLNLLPEILHTHTLKINANMPTSLNKLRNCATSFEFLVMYRQNIAVSEYTDVQEMYIIGRSMIPMQRENIDTPPQRIFNPDVIDYYTMAMESKDPFSVYISYYHVIEHYFDAVYRKKLTEEIKLRITRPDFSYNNEDNLYSLAKYIKKHMNSDDDSGKGNEMESLKYVLAEYVPITELKDRINILNPNAVSYYQRSNVPFVSQKETKIGWTDMQGVYTKLATRIYETRNALVHSKSEHGGNQYKPYTHRQDLLAEIDLIKAVAEIVLINSSTVL